MSSYAKYECLKVEVADKIATVSLNRPEARNAINQKLIRELRTIWDDLGDDHAVNVVVLTGAGDFFSVGGDVKAMSERPGGDVLEEGEVHDPMISRRAVTRQLELDKPIIAAINGDAIGLAATHALLCDITVMAEDARIGDTHVSRVGLVAGDGGTIIWPLLIGVNKAKEYLIRGTLLKGKEAERIGLVNHVVERSRGAGQSPRDRAGTRQWTDLGHSLDQIVDQPNRQGTGEHAAGGVDGAGAGDVRNGRSQGSGALLQGKAQAEIRPGIALPMESAQLPNDEIREMLRDSLRGFLAERWDAAAAASDIALPEAISSIWNGLVGQGVAPLGSDFNEGGLREILVVMAELGRAACLAPMWSAALTNLALSDCDNEAAVELRRKLHDGTARIAFSFGAFAPDRNEGSIRVENERASGLLRFVEVAASCTHLVVPIDESELAIIELGAAGLDIEPTRAMGAWGLYEIRVSAVAADAIRLQRPVVDDLLPEAKLALTARAYGAARRAFELAVDYAKERHQFGQPIGKFQAIQHKLANCLIALEGVRLTLDDAARLHDQDDRNWRYFANAAVAFAGEALRRVSLETQHAFGAIGYAEEHEAPRHFKRVHLDTIALGGAPHAQASRSPRFCSIMAVRACRNMISALPATRCARPRNSGLSRTGRVTARPPSMPDPSPSASSIRNSHGKWARRDGSGSDGRSSSTARGVPRWSRSLLSRPWSAARRRASVPRSRPTR